MNYLNDVHWTSYHTWSSTSAFNLWLLWYSHCIIHGQTEENWVHKFECFKKKAMVGEVGQAYTSWFA